MLDSKKIRHDVMTKLEPLIQFSLSIKQIATERTKSESV